MYQAKTDHFAAQLENLGFDLASDYDVEETPVPSPCLSARSYIELSPPAPAVPRDTLSSHRLSYPPGTRLSPTKSRPRGSSPVKKNRPPRDAVDLSLEFDELTLTGEETSKTVPGRPIWTLSKPLPDIPEKCESGGGGHSLTRSTSNVAGTLKGLVQNRLKRRGDSRDEKTTPY